MPKELLIVTAAALAKKHENQLSGTYRAILVYALKIFHRIPVPQLKHPAGAGCLCHYFKSHYYQLGVTGPALIKLSQYGTASCVAL